MSALLAVANLDVTLDGRSILRDVNFELSPGENLAVIGPNGSGKTVLLRSLLGLIPYTGKIEWAKDARVGYVPQKIDADRHLPLNLQNLLEAKAYLLGLSAPAIGRVTDRVGIPSAVLKTPVGKLSGGQFQKALIAFALLGDPNVVLFDEPTASLDQLAEEHVYELLEELHEKEKLTVILVSHELSVVYKYSERVLCLNKNLLCFGTPDQALTPDVLAALYGSEKHHHHA